MKRLTVFVVVLILVGMLFPALVAADSSLSGSFFVTNSIVGKPVPDGGLAVYLYSAAQKFWTKPVYTDSLGRFAVPGLKSGTYLLRAVNRQKKTVWEQEVRLKGDSIALSPIVLKGQ